MSPIEIIQFANQNCIPVSEVPGFDESGFYESDFVDRIGSPFHALTDKSYNWDYLGRYDYADQDLILSQNCYYRRIMDCVTVDMIDKITPSTTWQELEMQMFQIV